MTFKDKQELVTELCKLWQCTLVGHHKDVDCHYYIKMKWSYGQEPVYVVEHYGYILEDTYEEFPTYAEALNYLIAYLMKGLANECEFYLTNPNNEEEVAEQIPRFLNIRSALTTIAERLNAA